MESPLSILKKHHIRPVKRLGQSFLVDNNITSRIVDSSGIGEGVSSLFYSATQHILFGDKPVKSATENRGFYKAQKSRRSL